MEFCTDTQNTAQAQSNTGQGHEGPSVPSGPGTCQVYREAEKCNLKLSAVHTKIMFLDCGWILFCLTVREWPQYLETFSPQFLNSSNSYVLIFFLYNYCSTSACGTDTQCGLSSWRTEENQQILVGSQNEPETCLDYKLYRVRIVS